MRINGSIIGSNVVPSLVSGASGIWGLQNVDIANRSRSWPTELVTNGLVLLLDANNTNSYPGTGTTWFDLSGINNNGTLTNGASYNSASGGSIVFDGVNDYVGSFPTQISGVGSKTICAFIYPTTTSRAGICGIRGAGDGTGWVFTINRTSSGNLTYFHTTGTTVEVSAGISINNWVQVCVTYSTVTSTVILYKNGYQVGSTVTSVSSIVSSTFNGVIGDEDSTITTPFKGNISNLQIYNRSLSATEILQNFQATRTRFGV